MNNQLNKVPASSGAQWILDAFAAFRAAPGPYLVVAGTYAAGVLVATLLMRASPVFGMLVLLVMTLMQPIFMGALVLGANEAAAGQHPGKGLLPRVHATGKTPQLLLTLVPQIAAGLISGFLLYFMVGSQNLSHTFEVLQAAQTNPEAQAELMKQLPLAAFGRWALLTFVLGVLAAMFTFLAIPQILFNGRRSMDAMRDSFRGVTGNLTAVILGFIFFVITVLAILVAFMIVSGLISVVAGRGAADLIGSFLQILVLLPLQGLITYAAWKSIFGNASNTPAIDSARSSNQFEA